LCKLRARGRRLWRFLIRRGRETHCSHEIGRRGSKITAHVAPPYGLLSRFGWISRRRRHTLGRCLVAEPPHYAPLLHAHCHLPSRLPETVTPRRSASSRARSAEPKRLSV